LVELWGAFRKPTEDWPPESVVLTGFGFSSPLIAISYRGGRIKREKGKNAIHVFDL